MAVAADSTAGARTLDAPPLLPRPDWRVVLVAVLLLGGGALFILGDAAWRQAALYLVGGVLGLVLYHAAFGFSASWRAFLVEGRGAGLRAQMLMLAVATTIFLPAIAAGSFLGQPVGGAFGPVGVSVLVGAFIFGVGMQLGGGCASGTLYTVGGGSVRMMVVLVFFIAGSLLGSLHIPWWLETPGLGTISLVGDLGLAGALTVQLGLFALVAALTVAVERRRHGSLLHGGGAPAGPWSRRLFQGPWPLLWGAVLLALLNAAVLALAGHPWTVSFGYTLWGAKAASGLGLDVASWEFWTWRYPRQALAGSLFANNISVLNFGIVAGAFLAAGLAGGLAPVRRIPWRSLVAAALGGLLMGYGARLGFGCNVGAYFSGIASGSLHGWLWFVAALAGTFLGALLRPAFGLPVEKPAARSC